METINVIIIVLLIIFVVTVLRSICTTFNIERLGGYSGFIDEDDKIKYSVFGKPSTYRPIY